MPLEQSGVPVMSSEVLNNVASTDQPTAEAPAAEQTGASSSLRSVILRNTLAITVGGWIIKVLNTVYVILVVRVLGEEGYGQFTTIMAFVGLFSVFFELGLSQYVKRTIAQRREPPEMLFWNLVALRLILAVLGLASIPLIALNLGYAQGLVIGTLLYTGTFVLSALLVPLGTLFEAYERYDIVLSIDVVAQLLTVITGVTLLWLGFGLYALLLVGYVVMPLQIAISYFTLRHQRLGPPPLRFAPRNWPMFIRASFPFALTSLALALNFNVDSVVLNWFHGDAEVGWYSASYRLVFSIVGFVGGFIAAFTPSIAREHVTNPEQTGPWAVKSIHWLTLFAIPAGVGVSILAPSIVVLLFGGSFAPAGPTLALLAWDIPLMLINAFYGNLTAAIGLERPASRIFLVSVALNVLLNILFIPGFGRQAAAAVTLATDLLSALAFFVLLNRHLTLDDVRPLLGKTALAAGLMAVAVWLARDLWLPIPIALGAAIYGLIALRLDLFDRELLGWLRGRAMSVARMWRKSGQPAG